ncbi:radical SAM protein [Candidatus Pacearchaeota archaeon]|nr:radical SAM protein [Candidatus Pacearchaeota archaeon]
MNIKKVKPAIINILTGIKNRISIKKFRLKNILGLSNQIFYYIKNKLFSLKFLNKKPYYPIFNSFARPPRQINIMVNNICNSKCVMCDIGIKNKESFFYKNLVQDGKNTLSPETLKKFIDEVKTFKPYINICATEPLLHPKIIELIQIVKDAKLKLTLTTNGLLLKKYAKQIALSELDKILVSLDGLKQTHNKIRGIKIFDRAIEGINLVKKYRDEAQKKYPLINPRFTISNFNYKELFKFSEYMFEKVKVDRISFSHLYFVSEDAADKHNKKFSYLGKSSAKSIKLMNPSKIDVNLLLEQIQNVNEKYGNKVGFYPENLTKDYLYEYYNPKIIPKIGKKRCFTPWEVTVLQANGDMIIRNVCIPYKVGNIHKQSFKSIWNGKRYRYFRKQLKKYKLFPMCHRCCAVVYPKK